MSAFLIASGFFFLSLTVHVGVWRLRLPKHHTRALLLIFALVPVVGAGVLLMMGRNPGWPGLQLADVPGMALFYLGATACYLITYAGVEEVSPSLLIIRALEAAPAKGCTRDELAALITKERFVLPRLRALQRDGLLAPADTGAALTARGLRAARVATRLAQIFNLHESA
jgi:hypothetical protein